MNAITLTADQAFDKLNKSFVKRMIKRWNRNKKGSGNILMFDSKKNYSAEFKEMALDFYDLRKQEHSEKTVLLRQEGKTISVTILADMGVNPDYFDKNSRGEAEEEILNSAFQYALKKGYKKVKVCKLDSIDANDSEVPMGCFNFNDAKSFERIYDYNGFIGYYPRCW